MISRLLRSCNKTSVEILFITLFVGVEKKGSVSRLKEKQKILKNCLNQAAKYI